MRCRAGSIIGLDRRPLIGHPDSNGGDPKRVLTSTRRLQSVLQSVLECKLVPAACLGGGIAGISKACLLGGEEKKH